MNFTFNLIIFRAAYLTSAITFLHDINTDIVLPLLQSRQKKHHELYEP